MASFGRGSGKAFRLTWADAPTGAPTKGALPRRVARRVGEATTKTSPVCCG
eukprot:CAMPEP_0170590282 /NCGR_PEP_ID=MMETSP0224-20130122/11787_1 /TAXON_ID=285029 /ORGANISM="Togula jolla, Strain CCCM 725" /LENGTH=50 /DNA_ID=CAMNT_0010914069 /DNA_START=83 /DNA_END=232 /DNA_ORIENTATION=+